MRKLALILLASLAMAQTEALLPPLYQGSNELKAILENQQLGQKLGSGDVIMKIEKTDQGYEITTNKHRLPITVTYEKMDRPGPAQYVIRFGDAIPLE